MLCRVTVLVLLIAPALAAREDEKAQQQKKENVHVSVHPRSFSQIRDNSQPEDRGHIAASSDGDESKEVLSRSHGRDQKAQPSESMKEQAKAKLMELARERKAVLEHADNLDRQMHEQYAAMIGTEVGNVASLLSVSQHDDNAMSEDEQFAELEKHTSQMMQWFADLKQLRSERDAMLAHKKAAVSTGAMMGLSSKEVQTELDTLAAEAEQKVKKAGVSEEQRQHLASVMASSAIEMAQIKSASDDVLSALQALTEWKKRDDDSHESHMEAVKVKARLTKAIQFLQEHEDLVNVRTQQINSLMKEAGMGHL